MATVADRLRMIAMRVGFGLTQVGIFGLGSSGTFLLFEWPPLLRQVMLAYLLAVVGVRLALILGRVALVRDGTAALGDPERFWGIPMPADYVHFWHRRLAWFVGYYAFGWATIDVFHVLRLDDNLMAAAASRECPRLEKVWPQHPSHGLWRAALAAVGRRSRPPVLARCGFSAASEGDGPRAVGGRAPAMPHR